MTHPDFGAGACAQTGREQPPAGASEQRHHVRAQPAAAAVQAGPREEPRDPQRQLVRLLGEAICAYVAQNITCVDSVVQASKRSSNVEAARARRPGTHSAGWSASGGDDPDLGGGTACRLSGDRQRQLDGVIPLGDTVERKHEHTPAD